MTDQTTLQLATQQLLYLVLDNIRNGNNSYRVIDCLSENVDEFRQICTPTQKDTIAHFLMQKATRNASAIDPCCFDIVYDDAYSVLRDICVQAVKNSDHNIVKIFKKYCRLHRQRALEEFKRITLEDLQENHDTWSLLTVLVYALARGVTRNIHVFILIDNVEYTKKYLSLLDATFYNNANGEELFLELIQEVITEYYEAVGDVQDCITTLIWDGLPCDVIARTLALQTCNKDQIEHYWRRLATADVDDVPIQAIRHLHSLYFTGHNTTAVAMFYSMINKDSVEVIDIIQQLVDYELDKNEDELQSEFIDAVLPFFYRLKNDRIVKYLKSTLERLFNRYDKNKIEKHSQTIISIFRENIVDILFTEDYIFDNILRRLQEGIEKKDDDSLDIFRFIAKYFHNSHQLQTRFAKEYKHCIQAIFTDNMSLEMIELGYAEFLTKNIIVNSYLANNWPRYLHAVEFVLDYCIEARIQPEWVETMYFEEEEVCDPILRRVQRKATTIEQLHSIILN